MLWDALANSAANLIPKLPAKTEEPEPDAVCAVCGCLFKDNPVKDIAINISNAISNTFTNYDILAAPTSGYACQPCYTMLKSFRGKSFAITPNEYIPFNPREEKERIVNILIDPPEFPIAINLPPPMYHKHLLIHTTINYSLPLIVYSDPGPVVIPVNFDEIYETGKKTLEAGAKNLYRILFVGNIDKIDPDVFEEATNMLMPYRDTPLFPLLTRLMPKIEAKKSKKKKGGKSK